MSDQLSPDERRLIDEAVEAGKVKHIARGVVSEEIVPTSTMWKRTTTGRSIAERQASSNTSARARAATL